MPNRGQTPTSGEFRWGPTGAGRKSHLMNELMGSMSRVFEMGSVVGDTQDQTSSTTGNIVMHRGEIVLPIEQINRPIIVLDVEGTNGRVPRTIRQQLEEQLEEIMWDVGDEERKREEQRVFDQRQKIVMEVFPQLCHCLSDVVVFVDVIPMTNTEWTKRVVEFAKRSTRNVGSGDKPALLMVQNMAKTGGTSDWSSESSTRQVMEELLRPSEKEELEQHFQMMRVVRIPSERQDADQYMEQVNEMKREMEGAIEKMKESRMTLREGSGFSEVKWIELVERVHCVMSSMVANESEGVEIGMTEMMSRLCSSSSNIQ